MENTREYPYNFGKVRAINTVFEEKLTRNLKIRHCVYIDVFPMDYVNIDNTAELVRKRTWVGHWTQIRYEKLHLVSGFKLFPFRILPIEFINRKAQKNMKYCFVNKGQYVQKLCHFGPNKPPINISMFNDVIKVPFNGYKFNVPKEYDIFLTGRYGNYMELPPLQKQCPSHHIVRIEL